MVHQRTLIRWLSFLLEFPVLSLIAGVAATVGILLAAAMVSPVAETDPVPSSGDSADDACIWVHPTNPALSTIIGTDKNGGLGVYNLDGSEIQFITVDVQANNADIRYNFPLDGESVALVGISDQDDKTIGLYKVDPATRLLVDVEARSIETGTSVHGFCMYHSPISGKYYCFITGNNEAQQWELFDDGNGKVDAVKVRTLPIGSHTEGCVADDEFGHFYIAEEDVAIWKYNAEPNGGTSRTKVDDIAGGRLEDDIEGLTMYYANDGTGYLIASSQGSNEFVVYEREGNNDHVMTFEIVAGNGIDGCTNTDGIDVLNFPLGTLYPFGVFVAQDGGNDTGNQNFKMVKWDDIANSVSPPLTIDTSWDPREIGAGNCDITADFDSELSTGCLPLTVDFVDASTGPVTSWLWNFGDGSTSTLQNPSHTYSEAGSFNVSLTVSSSVCSRTETKTNYIITNDVPAASFQALPASGSAPLSVSFTDQSSGNPDSWLWSFGDGGTSTQQHPTHTYTSPGTFVATLTASNSCGSDNTSTNIVVTVPAAYSARLNCGGPIYNAINGDQFGADRAYSTGGFGYVGGSSFSFSNAIGGTSDDPLYQTLRGHLLSFEYRFDVPMVADYEVKLHFMAPQFGSGNIVMDVSAEGSTMISGLDIEDEAGGTFQALSKSFFVHVSDGSLNLLFNQVNKAAVLSGLEVLESTPPPPAPDIDVTPMSLNFGQVVVGQMDEATVEIDNTGSLDLTVQQLDLANDVFSLVNPPATPFTVTAGGNAVSLTVRFSPDAAVTESGHLEIISDDPDEGSVKVDLDGEGISNPTIDEFRINCAGSNYVDQAGDLFVADQAYNAGSFGYVGGRGFSFSNSIGGTNDDPLYQTLRAEREQTFSYRFDVSTSGDFLVTLYLMAPAFGTGNSVMDVLSEGNLVYDDLDVDSEAGGTYQALIKSFITSVNDGTLDLDFVPVNKAALVGAIAVVQQTTSPQLAKETQSRAKTVTKGPIAYQLHQNHPNPFNPATTIRYQIPIQATVSLKIYDLTGKEVRTLVAGLQAEGVHEVSWDGRNEVGGMLPSGLYFYRLQAAEYTHTRKMILAQ